MMAKVFTFPLSIYLKMYLAKKKRGTEGPILMSGAASLCANTPGIDSCQLGEELGFPVFYYCGFLGWAAGCLIMIKTIIILHNYVLPFARTWI